MNADNTIEAVITSFNQKSMICEAVESVCRQTIKPVRILVVDDGSTDEMSVSILNELESDRGISVPLEVIRQPNGGVSAAYSQIVAGMQEHGTIPSFASTSRGAVVKELSWNGEKYVLNLTDTNGVLSKYNFTSSDPKSRIIHTKKI